MIRAVLDTNVIISTLITTKLSPVLQLYNALKYRQFIHLTSWSIIDEVEEVLNRANIIKLHKLQPLQLRIFLHELTTLSEVIPPLLSVTVVKNDPDDNKFIACAIEGSASHIVTGDKQHLLPLKEYRGIKIVSVRSFLEEL